MAEHSWGPASVLFPPTGDAADLLAMPEFRVDGELKMSYKKVVLVNAAEPLPNLSFLI